MTAPRLTKKRQRVHAVLQRAGATGATLPELMQVLAGQGMTSKGVHNLLRALRSMDLVEQRQARGPYFALELMDAQAVRTMQARAMEIVADCPGGVSDLVLAQEIDQTPAEVWRLLAPAVKSGALLRVRMPQAHGGGKGFAMGVPAAAQAAAAAPAEPAPAAGAAPGMAAASGAIGAFELLDQSCLAIAWSGARVVLPAEVTRGLFRYLDALGGLQLSNHLQAEVGAA